MRRGLTAGTFQHEVDHLDGVLFLDRVRDPTTFSTWEQFDRHHRAEFEARARAIVERRRRVTGCRASSPGSAASGRSRTSCIEVEGDRIVAASRRATAPRRRTP